MTEDTLIVTGGDGGCGTEEKAMKYQVPDSGVEVFKSPGHFQNWLDCIRTREKPLMHIEAGRSRRQSLHFGEYFIYTRPETRMGSL